MKQYKLSGLNKGTTSILCDGAQRVDDYHNKGKTGGVFEGTKVRQWINDKTEHFLLVPNAHHHVEIETKYQLVIVQETNPQNFIAYIFQITTKIYIFPICPKSFFFPFSPSQNFILNFRNKRNMSSNKAIHYAIFQIDLKGPLQNHCQAKKEKRGYKFIYEQIKKKDSKEPGLQVVFFKKKSENIQRKKKQANKPTNQIML
ncbi:hypothetical protein RFI_25564 [Reticulomyxa filosa]|uniref:Uncharacterized protein n=1 Tax=Reticulomyxa filosa TaxID=46433 RepID=X6MEG2_RETFI|nr:hypothetical protein RFI_25564 [Reticulomyxa filosa]|eukprot:ETO11812.1 hypothetical protein RFI_25564 [Reticulomyxa filosa]